MLAGEMLMVLVVENAVVGAASVKPESLCVSPPLDIFSFVTALLFFGDFAFVVQCSLLWFGYEWTDVATCLGA